MTLQIVLSCLLSLPFYWWASGLMDERIDRREDELARERHRPRDWWDGDSASSVTFTQNTHWPTATELTSVMERQQQEYLRQLDAQRYGVGQMSHLRFQDPFGPSPYPRSSALDIGLGGALGSIFGSGPKA